jgi:protein SCO1/2
MTTQTSQYDTQTIKNDSGNRSRFLIIFGLSIVVILLGYLIYILFSQPYTFNGSLIEPPIPADDFELSDQNGGIYRLSDQQGDVVLLFFGYTNCPDVCPVTLSDYRRMIPELEDDIANVEFVFISVDPERDTTIRLADYLDNFDARIIGLTGDTSTLEDVWANYGVFAEKRDVGSAAGYLVDHTARLYVVDKQGYLRLTYPFGFEIEGIIGDVKHLVDEK